MVDRERQAHLFGSGMQVAARFSERIGMDFAVQIEAQEFYGVTIRERVVVSKRDKLRAILHLA